jgi:hypothetical protein
MADSTNYEKLAGVFNRAGQQGKVGFCKMLWDNQPETVQAQLVPLLDPSLLSTLQAEP